MKSSSLVFPMLLSLVALPGLAAAPADSHAGHGAAVAELQLNHGQKWETDAPLREGMAAIRRQLTGSSLHGAQKVTMSDYATLGGEMEKQVGKIVSECKLEPKADAMLHLVIADLSQAAAKLQGKVEGKPSEAVHQAIVALNKYGEYFNHPGWQPIK